MPEVRRARAADLARLVAFLDDGFVFGKGRSNSLARRFPGVFDEANARNLFFIEQDGVIVSALAARPFDWISQGRTWRGVMIGSVLTSEAHRGTGLAGRVLEHAAKTLSEEGRADFAVLWTSQPDFYRRFGWQSSDRGVLGQVEGQAATESPGLLAQGVTSDQWGQVEGIRARSQLEGLRRAPADFARLPLPAEAVQVFFDSVVNPQAYALVGRAGTSGIVYEMIGDPGSFAVLWRNVLTRFSAVLINDCEGSASHRWHKTHSDVTWQQKPLAMWLPLSSGIDFATMRDWYVPYFDRI